MALVDIVFIQDWESERDDNPETPEWGEWEAMAEYLTQWDFGTETDYAHALESEPWGTSDDTREFVIGGLAYTLSTNSHLHYAGLTRAALETE